MQMPHPPWRNLYHFALLCVPAISQSTPTAILPQSLRVSIPQCGHSCLASFLSQTLSPELCSEQDTLDCICSRYSTTGFTVGELALACLRTACPPDIVQDVSPVYGICEGRIGSVTAFHDVITVASLLPTTASTSSKERLATVQPRIQDERQSSHPQDDNFSDLIFCDYRSYSFCRIHYSHRWSFAILFDDNTSTKRGAHPKSIVNDNSDCGPHIGRRGSFHPNTWSSGCDVPAPARKVKGGDGE